MVDYYVNQAGSGAGDGTIGDPWKALAEITGLAAGDNVFLNRGDTWAERLIPTVSGVIDNPITYNAYGTGSLPILNRRGEVTGWDTSGNWTEDGANHWKFSLSESPIRLWISDAEGLLAENDTGLTSKYNWYYDGTGDFLWLYSVGNPAGVISDLEGASLAAPGPSHTVTFYSVNYITIKNLDLRGSVFCVRVGNTGLAASNIVIDSCNIGLYSGYGVYGNTSTNVTVQNCTIASGFNDTYQSELNCQALVGVNIRNNTANWYVHNNTFTNWGLVAIQAFAQTGNTTHDHLIYDNDISAPGCSYGRGFTVDGAGNEGAAYNIDFYRNEIHDTTVQNQVNGRDVRVYYNIFRDMVKNATGHGFDVGEINKTLGLVISDYATECVRVKIYNNVFSNIDEAGLGIISFNSFDMDDCEVTNNICFNTGRDSFNAVYPYSIFVSNVANITGLISRNNILYRSGITDVASYRGTDMTVAEFNAGETGTDVIDSNLNEDPLFTDPDTDDYTLQSGSPAEGVGFDVGLYDGQSNIGRYEPAGTIVTANGRYSWIPLFPIPDGTVSKPDRAQWLELYPDIALALPSVVTAWSILDNISTTIGLIQDSASPANTEWNIINNINTTLGVLQE